MFKNEEDIKLKVALPFLKSLGFQENELSFEKSFSLKLGRHTYRVDTEKQCQESQPRLDILVKRDNQNLFIVEVKSDIITISQDDIDQAISYARLVDPIAPFTIVTNGKEFKIFDSIDKKEIEQAEFKIQDCYSGALPDASRYEALKYFIGYSKENVKAFCGKQVLEGMRTLLGSSDHPDKKFIPELYSPRRDLNSTIKTFLDSDSPVFGLIGDSGIGKTCSMCALAQEMLNASKPILFYRARDFIGGIFKIIADDFNWIFSSEFTEIQVIKRISELFANEKLMIFIEAIDEWNISNKIEMLDNFLKQIGNRNFKVILSCKTSAWEAFLSQNGTPTILSELIYIDGKGALGYQLTTLTDEEFHYAVKKYREFYKFDGLFEHRVLEEAKRLPFLLRIFFSVAEKCGLKNLTFSSLEFFTEYYNLTLAKFAKKESAYATILEIAKCLLKNDAELTDLNSIRSDLGLSVSETIMPELFEYNVLTLINEQQNTKIGFYFSLFRDYVTAYYVLKLQEISLEQYEKSLKEFFKNRIFQEALKLFYPFSSLEKKGVIDQELRTNAAKYLDFYEKVIVDHFLAFREQFRPNTKWKIGFIGELSIPEKRLFYHGFRPLEDKNEERIKFIPIDPKMRDKRSNITYLEGAMYLHITGSSKGFVEIDIEKEVLSHEIIDQLKQIVEKGLLNESNNPHLLLEKVIAIICKYQSKGLGGLEFLKLPHHLPISFESIENNMRYNRAWLIYSDELIEKKREAGEIKETWRGSSVSFGYTSTKADQEWIHDKAQEAVKNGIYIKSKNKYGNEDKVDETLSNSLSSLRSLGYTSIAETIVPKVEIEYPKFIWGYYTYSTIVKYVESLFQLYLDEYQKLVKFNFPTIAEHFKLYSLMPIRCFIVIGKEDTNVDYIVNIYMCKGHEQNRNIVTTCKNDELGFNFKTFKVSYSGQLFDCFEAPTVSISYFFSPIRTYIDFPVEGRFMMVRNLVYQQIHEELGKVEDYLYKFYQVKKANY